VESNIQNNKPIVIAQIESPLSDPLGDSYYRTYAPGLSLAEQDNIYFIGLTLLHRNIKKIIHSADVLILKDVCDIDLIPLLRERHKNPMAYRTFFEISSDMYADDSANNPYYSFYQNFENRQILKKIITECNGLQLASHELNVLYGHYHRNSVVFSDKITIIPPDRPPRDHDAAINIGLIGADVYDILDIEEPLIEWVNANNAVLHVMCSEKVWNEFNKRLFNSVSDGKKIRHNPGNINDYYDFLRNIDIGVAPLFDTTFNRSKSNVLYLEYAVNEVVPVMQNFGSYRRILKHPEKPGVLFSTRYELIDILDTFVNRTDLIANMSKAAKQYVLSNHLQSAQSAERINYYTNDYATGKPFPFYNEDNGVKLFAELSKQANAELQGRHLMLRFGEYENLMMNGIAEMKKKNMVNAHQIFLHATDIEPDEYFPCLMAHDCMPDKAESDYWPHLLDAFERNPQSVKAFIQLGELFANMENYDIAIEYFEKAASILPDYGLIYDRLANVHDNLGNEHKAKHYNRLAFKKMW